jgi:hypothetical protein
VKKKQAGRADRPVLLETDFVSNYAVRLLRSIRRILAPNGTSNAPKIIVVVGSGTAWIATLSIQPALESKPDVSMKVSVVLAEAAVNEYVRTCGTPAGKSVKPL